MGVELGYLDPTVKVPLVALDRRTQVLKWGCSLAAPWAVQSFTVPLEGPHRVLIASWPTSYWGTVAGFGALEVRVDNVVVGYHRTYVNQTGHRPHTPLFLTMDLTPGAHTLSLAVWSGSPTLGISTNNFWSFFILGCAPQPTARATRGSGADATIGTLRTIYDASLRQVDTPARKAYRCSGIETGPWNGTRRPTELKITQAVTSKALVVVQASAYNSVINTINYMTIALQSLAAVTMASQSVGMSSNQAPMHRQYTPYVWYGDLPVGEWAPVLTNGAGTTSDAQDYIGGFAITGI